MPLVRLDKILTDTGLCSRSQAREIIRRGRAAVNGTPCADPAAKFDPEAVSLTVDGEPIDGPGHIYIMLNKPAGVLTATRDPRKPTVVDAMPEDWKRRGLFPVGRLDKDTTGLLLLTDDGTFAHKVISPKSHVSKLYEAVVDGTPCEADHAAFREGIVLRDGTQCLPAELIDLGGGRVQVEVFDERIAAQTPAHRRPVAGRITCGRGVPPLDAGGDREDMAGHSVEMTNALFSVFA